MRLKRPNEAVRMDMAWLAVEVLHWEAGLPCVGRMRRRGCHN